MKASRPSWIVPLLLSGLILSSCSLERGKSGSFRIRIENPNAGQIGAGSELPFRLLAPASVPTTIADFSCFTVNVTGAGIVPLWTTGLGSSASSCTSSDRFNGRDQGVIPKPVTLETPILLDLPSGSARTIDVYGVYPATPACGGTQGAAGTTTSGYWVGSATVDHFDDLTVSIPVSYAGEAAKITCVEDNGPAVAPAGCTYANATPSYMVGTAITSNVVSCTSGSPTSFSISPNLSSLTGLSFNTSTGAITGTPTTGMASTAFTVTATNAYGSTTASVTIEALMACTSTVTSTLNLPANTLPASVVISYSMVGGGGGGANGAAGTNGITDSGTFTIPASQILDVYVGGGGGAGGTGSGGGGGGGSSAIILNGVPVSTAAGGSGANLGLGGGGGGGGTTSGGTPGAAGTGGGSGAGGGAQTGGLGGSGGGTTSGGGGGSGYFGGGGGGGDTSTSGSGGTGGNTSSGGAVGGGTGGGGGGYGGGGGGAGGSGGTSGANGTGSGGVGATTWSAATTLPGAAGQAGGGPSVGGNAGLVILSYSYPTCPL